MAVRVQPYPLKLTHVTAAKQRSVVVRKRGPRRCMVVSTSLIFAGLSIPFLMALGILPITLLLGLVGFGLAGAGGIAALIFCGEI